MNYDKPSFASKAKDDYSLTRTEGNASNDASYGFHRLLIASATAATLCATPFCATGTIPQFVSYYPTDVSVSGFALKRMQIVEDIFALQNQKDIKQYLAQNTSFVEILIKCQAEITKRFGNSFLKIELHQDSEMSEWQTLFVTISTHLEYNVAIEKLNSFLREWIFLQTKEFRKAITISIE